MVSAGHSAANTLLALAELAEQEPPTRITWLIRNASAVRVTTSDDDELSARASIGRRVEALVAAGKITVVDRFEIVRLGRTDNGVRLYGCQVPRYPRITKLNPRTQHPSREFPHT